ncbi:MAG: hypothetical protein CVU68_04190 [Deltaproteobacteria bacterium HGW-Deltaproteobacteria-3]|nr:MAG: hypothetical protein CVU68_04190 [Deltaproteobacteria bacterium HGW-Deltaproteobacteria-3]
MAANGTKFCLSIIIQTKVFPPQDLASSALFGFPLNTQKKRFFNASRKILVRDFSMEYKRIRSLRLIGDRKAG